MGAEQSSAKGKKNADTSKYVKASYYAVLGVDRDADDSAIKKAYRRKALELHPDKNIGNEEAATRDFGEVQAAYEVLSDPHERAWYDSHEDTILRGKDVFDDGPTFADVKFTTADDLARLVKKFNSKVKFSDDPTGFYGFVRETFEKLAHEEVIAAEWQYLSPPTYPSFGRSADTYEGGVKTFYATWSKFFTIKSFRWKDQYNEDADVPRDIRRQFSQLNKKRRDAGKRDFNDAVKALLAFVKKRDPRFVPTEETEEDRIKALREASAAQSRRARAANQEKLGGDVPEWARSRHDEEEETEETEEEAEVEVTILECVVCDKTFKSEGQLVSHFKSKKHQKAAKDLKRDMKKQNHDLNLEEHEPVAAGSDEEIDTEPNGAEDVPVRDKPSEEPTKPLHQVRDDEYIHLPVDTDLDTKEVEDDDDDEGDDDDDYAPIQAIQARMESVAFHPSPPINTSDSPINNNNTHSPTEPKLGKAKQKRAKKAAAAAAEAGNGQYASLPKCHGCDADFASKNELFYHLKQNPGHASVKSARGGATAIAKGARRLVENRQGGGSSF